MFIIRDERHSELFGEYDTFADALAQLRSVARIPWPEPPNVAPCTSWRTCGRVYQIVEYDDTVTPWNEVKATNVLEIDARGVRWEKEFA